MFRCHKRAAYDELLGNAVKLAAHNGLDDQEDILPFLADSHDVQVDKVDNKVDIDCAQVEHWDLSLDIADYMHSANQFEYCKAYSVYHLAHWKYSVR